MTVDIQKKIDRTIGLSNVSLIEFTDLTDIVPHIASSCPASTVGDLSVNIAAGIERLEHALAQMKAFKAELDAKPADSLVLISFMQELEGSFLFDEKECGSSMGWLLKVAFEEYRAGNTQAVPRFVTAHTLLSDVYVSDAGNDLENPYNTLSETFDAFCDHAVLFVKGSGPIPSAYADFIREREAAVMH